MIPAPSCLGKLPLHGDFLRIRVNQLQKVCLDQWFAVLRKANVNHMQVVEKSASAPTTASLPWCFVMRGGLLGASKRLFGIGVLFDSFDKIGRSYPFIIYQLVPKRWLINQLNGPDHWLECLQQFAQACPDNDSVKIDRMLNQLWAIYKPHGLDYFKAPSAVKRQKMARQAEQLLKSWRSSHVNTNIDDVGVANPPWADWPRHIAHSKGSIWWQLDDAGRYLDCVEHACLDETLIEQLLIRPRHV